MMINRKNLKQVLTTALCVTALSVWSLGSSVQANEAEVAEFYAGNTVELLVGYSAGGGYDAYSRTLARHIGRHIPGNPEVIVKNVPGAGSLVLMNQLANSLPNDGSVFGAVNSGMAYEPLFANDKAQFETNKMSWIGNLNVEVALGFARKDTGAESIYDLRDTRISMGATGAGANTNVIPRVLAAIYDLQIDVIAGYPGAADVRLAVERGEIDGIGMSALSSTLARTPEWLEPDSEYAVLWQVAAERAEQLPDVPLASDMAETEEQRLAVELLVARLAMGRPFVAPPGVPAERFEALRDAFMATVEDPEFLADAEGQGLIVQPVSGQEMQEYFGEVYGFPQEIVDLVKSAMTE
jgi:tripartite-type tricarboxylate transporter receptor subunit TctC